MEKSPEQTLNLYNIYIFKKTMGACNYLFLYFQARALQEKREAIDKQKKKEKKKQKTSSWFKALS